MIQIWRPSKIRLVSIMKKESTLFRLSCFTIKSWLYLKHSKSMKWMIYGLRKEKAISWSFYTKRIKVKIRVPYLTFLKVSQQSLTNNTRNRPEILSFKTEEFLNTSTPLIQNTKISNTTKVLRGKHSSDGLTFWCEKRVTAKTKGLLQALSELDPGQVFILFIKNWRQWNLGLRYKFLKKIDLHPKVEKNWHQLARNDH